MLTQNVSERNLLSRVGVGEGAWAMGWEGWVGVWGEGGAEWVGEWGLGSGFLGLATGGRGEMGVRRANGQLKEA